MTGRERRCGWLDLVALRFAVRVNGITSLALTKLDVLSAFDEIPVCVRYRLPDGTETEDFPAHQSDFHHCAPGLRDPRPAGSEELDGADAVPHAARALRLVRRRTRSASRRLVGTGRGRETPCSTLAAA